MQRTNKGYLQNLRFHSSLFAMINLLGNLVSWGITFYRLAWKNPEKNGGLCSEKLQEVFE